MGQSSNYRVLFGSDGLTFLLPDKNDMRAMAGRRPVPVDRSFHVKYSVMRMKLAGGRPWKDISGAEPTGSVSNYQNPADVKSWIVNVPRYGRVKVANVYEGIDLILYTHDDNLEYDFVVGPGADPKQVQVVFEGMKGMRVDKKSGDLVLTAPDGSELRQFRPNVYQQLADKRVEVAGGYKLLGPGRAAFTLAAYDRSRAVVIDPTVDFTTFYGGSSADEPYAIAVDDDGNTYITGGTLSLNFPVSNGSKYLHCKVFGPPGDFCVDGLNAFVAKLDPTGKVVYASYAGVGYGSAIAVDSTGVYVTGEVLPPDIDNVIGFPNNNHGDSFVWRLESKGGLQDYSAMFGLDGVDYGTAIGVDSQHNAWVADTSDYGPPKGADVVISKFDPNGKFLKEFRFGSDGDDVPYGMTIGPSTADRAWITGKTCGNGFPTTDGVTHLMSHCGVFVLVLENSGVENLGMVFGGIDGDDEGTAIMSNGAYNAYITGRINSSQFPAPGDGFLNQKFPGTQGFVAQVDLIAHRHQLLRGTLFGAADGTTIPWAITRNELGGVYVTGSTSSSHLPGGPFLTPNPTAGFVTKFSNDLTQVRYTQLLGLVVSGVALGRTTLGPPPIQQIYTTGWRYTGGNDKDHEDAFVVKLEESMPASAIVNLPQETNGPSFPVSWSGTDASASIESFDVYVSDNGGPFTAFQTRTAATSATFSGMSGHSYGFFSVATDTAGNREPMKTAPDAVVADGPQPLPPVTQDVN